jgi:hypothetical protein
LGINISPTTAQRDPLVIKITQAEFATLRQRWDTFEAHNLPANTSDGVYFLFLLIYLYDRWPVNFIIGLMVKLIFPTTFCEQSEPDIKVLVEKMYIVALFI